MSLIHFIVYNIIKKGKKEFDKSNPPDYVLRHEQEIQSRAPKNVKVEQIANDGVNGEYVSKGNNPEDKVLMYIHGGGFVGGSPAARRAFTGYTAKKLGYNVYSIDYRLAPEYAFPFGAEDCLKAYKMLVEKYGKKYLSDRRKRRRQSRAVRSLASKSARNRASCLYRCVFAYAAIYPNISFLQKQCKNGLYVRHYVFGRSKNDVSQNLGKRNQSVRCSALR